MRRRKLDLSPLDRPRRWSVRSGGRGPAVVDEGCRLPAEFAVLHGVDVAGIGEPLEHLVVGPTGIFAVRTYTTASFIEIATGRGWRDGHPMLAQCERVAWEAIVTSDALNATVIPLLCLVGTMNSAGRYRAGSTIVCGQALMPAAICDRPRVLDRDAANAYVQAARVHTSVS